MGSEHNDKSTERIRSFLNGRMTPSERAAFELEMQRNPSLQDEVAFAKLMIVGLEELGQEQRGKRLKRVGLAVVLLVLLSAIGWYLGRDKDGGGNSFQAPSHHQVTGTGRPPQDTKVEQAGGASAEVSDRATAVQWNSQGQAILGGQFKGPAMFGNVALPARGETDVFLAAYSPEEGYLWAESIGSAEGQTTCSDLSIDAHDNIVITGQMFNNTYFGGKPFEAKAKGNLGLCDFYIAKLGPVGQLIWLDHNGGNAVPDVQTGDNLGRAVTVDPDGNIVAAGDYIGEVQFGQFRLPVGGPNEDAYIVKYSPNGEVLWAKAFTGQYMVSAYDVACDEAGDIFMVGYFGHHNLGGHMAFGNIVLNTYGGRDIWVAKISSKGNLLWAKHAGSDQVGAGGYDFGIGIHPDNRGGCLVTGWFHGNATFGDFQVSSHGDRDMFIAKYSKTGEVAWVNSGKGKGSDQGKTVAMDPDLNSYCAGYFTGDATFDGHRVTSVGERDIFITKYDQRGKLLWLRQMGGDHTNWNSEGPAQMSINKFGQIVLTGYFSGQMKIGDKLLESYGREDIFLVFFDKNGNLLESKQLNL